MKNIVQLHVGSFHRIISRLVDDIDVNIERKVPKLKFYNSQYVKNRLLQRFIELERVNIQLNASKFSGDIQGECFFNQSTVNLKYFKYSLESGILSIKLIFFLKSLLKFFMIWNKILFLYFVSLLKINCNNKKFTLVYGVHHDNFAGERKDKEFIRFCKKGPVSVLNNASHIIVQSHLKTISVEQKYAQYAENPLYFLLLNGKVSFNEFLTFFKNHLSMMFSYVKSCILFPPIAMLDDDFVNHALVDHLNRKSIIENIVITNSNGSCQPLWMNNLQDRYYRLHMAWYSQNTGFFQTFKWDPIRTPDMDIQKINVDEHWVWTKSFAETLKNIGINGLYNYVGPIMWYLPKSYCNPLEKRNYLSIGVFDVTPHGSNRLDREGYKNAYNYGSYKNLSDFILDIVDVSEQCEFNNSQVIKIFLKHKRKHKDSHDQDYIALVNDLSKNNENIEILDSSVNLFTLIEKCNLVVVLPYSSPAHFASYLGVPAIFYDPSKYIVPDFDKIEECYFASGKDELKHTFLNILKPENAHKAPSVK